jgi:hypothetical protein
MSETNEMRMMLVELGKELPQTRLFRNNVGMGYQGKKRANKDGSITLFDWRVLHAGLCTGSSDLIGVTRVLITPEMVGKYAGLFTAFEQKLLKGGKPSDEQTNFIEFVKRMGGVGSFTRSSKEAVEAVNTHELFNGL